MSQIFSALVAALALQSDGQGPASPPSLAQPSASYRNTLADFAAAEKVEVSPDLGAPIAQFSMQAALRHDWSLTTVYIYWRRPPAVSTMTPVYVLRTVGGTPRDAPITRWTTSESCPAVRDILTESQALKPPAINLPGLAPAEITSVMLDGAAFRFSTNSATFHNESSGQVSFSGNFDTPLADWYLAAQKKLQPCWRIEQPLAP